MLESLSIDWNIGSDLVCNYTMSMQRKFRELLGIRQTQMPTALVQLRPELLEAVAEIAVQDGRSIGEITNDLVRYALYDHRLAESSLRTWHQLTPREREITALIWLGLTNPEIAQRLSISLNTVKTHVKNILSKFNVHSKKSLSDRLVGLDLSDWTDVGVADPTAPISSESPHGVNP
jgi:DNA-binding CsgD family transcriptional regulator